MIKRGLSPVIAVVLLIMITVVAAGIIFGAVIPFTKNNLESGKECFDVLGDLSFADTAYNCYAVGAQNKTGFSIRVEDEKIIGFKVALFSQGSSDAIDVINGSNGQVNMLGGSTTISIPEKGEIRTYVTIGKFDKAEISPILESGGKCDLSDEIIFTPCDATIASEILSS